MGADLRYLLTIEYNGKNYSGWQYQKNALSVQQVIEEKLSVDLQEKTKIFASGRTDKGVHAKNQKAHFDTESSFPKNKLPLALNSMLPHDICIKDIVEVSEDFHAQYSAKRKTYIYQFYISGIESPLRYDTFAQIVPPFDYEKMKKASDLFLGTHNFKAFSSTGSGIKNTIRTLYKVELTKKDEEIKLEIEGNGFLYNMVRIIAGTLVWIGKGKLNIQDIKDAFETGDRKKAGKTFPAKALVLQNVNYDL